MSGGYYKYPRTPHLPFSPGGTKDDRRLRDINCFVGKEVVVTEKMDGENTSIYRDYYHARSINSITTNSLKCRHRSLISRIMSIV